MGTDLRAAVYQRRVVDEELDGLIAGGASAIAIEGAKAVGKTATAAERATSIFSLDETAIRELLGSDLTRLVDGSTVLIDEWQHLPETWNVVRRAVDAGARPGQFLLTGSASVSNPGTHSGAGRIITVRMRPMTLLERGLATPSVSLSTLLAGNRPGVDGSTSVGLADYVEEMLRSGFPGVRSLSERVRRAQLAGYVDRVIDRDIPDATGRTIRNPVALRRWLSAYAAATSTCASFETIRDASSSGMGEKPARSTTQPYRDALEALYILDPIPAWSPSGNPIAELGGAPKHQLVDPALAASLLGLGADALLSGDQPTVRIPRQGLVVGSLFESLVALDVRVYAQAAAASVGHFRTHRGDREVDLIVERDDGRVVAIEVKLSATVSDDDVKHLVWLRRLMGDRLLDAVVVTTGRFAYRRPDGVVVVPAALLGP